MANYLGGAWKSVPGGISVSNFVGSSVCVVSGSWTIGGGQVDIGMDPVTGVSGDMGSLFLVLRDYPTPFLFLEAQNLAGNTLDIPILGSFSPSVFLSIAGYEGSIGVTEPLSSTSITGSSSISCGPLGFKGIIVGINLSTSNVSAGHVVVSSVDAS